MKMSDCCDLVNFSIWFLAIVLLLAILVMAWPFSHGRLVAFFLGAAAAALVVETNPAGRFYFRGRFGVWPPRKEDWLAMKVKQGVVNARRAELAAERDKLFRDEDVYLKTVSPASSPDNARLVIKEGRELHRRVESAKQACEDADYLAERFHFNV